MSKGSLGQLALPGVFSLICFLAYGSQILFHFIEPHALPPRQTAIFNGLVVCIWITYLRACFTDPGYVFRSTPTKPWPTGSLGDSQRWCKKCEAPKPPRAHHCKICQRCIPKMDHHCPWTINCVSHRTFPHFLRFLLYAVTSMTYLEYFLYIRASLVWEGRNLPSYLGPTAAQMIFLFIFIVVNSVTLFALAILFARNLWCLGGNVTTIEGWEIERHEALVHRARKLGGYLNGPDGTRVRIQKQEFPYDIGIYANVIQGMGSNPLLWLWPFNSTPSNESGQDFETNEFEDPSLSWPPPDPERMPRSNSRRSNSPAFARENEMASDRDRLDAFRQRQRQDVKRFDHDSLTIVHRRTYGGHRSSRTPEALGYGSVEPARLLDDNGRGWRDSEGDRLDDFGVDEDVEFYDEDEVPLAELLRKKTSRTSRR